MFNACNKEEESHSLPQSKAFLSVLGQKADYWINRDVVGGPKASPLQLRLFPHDNPFT